MLLLCAETGSVKYNDQLVARLGQSETLVLSTLIQHAGELLTKDRLLDLGWPNKVVAPNSLTAAVKQIRKALKLIEQDVFIETVYRRGYIFHNPSDIEIVIISGDVPATPDAAANSCLPDPQAVADMEDAGEDNVLADAGPHSTKPAVMEHHHHIKDSSVTSERLLNNQQQAGVEPELIAVQEKPRWWLTLAEIRKWLLYGYFIIVASLAYIVYVARSDMSCLTVAEANVCGVVDLPGYKHSRIVELIGERKGNFYYGYNNKLESIEVHQIQ